MPRQIKEKGKQITKLELARVTDPRQRKENNQKMRKILIFLFVLTSIFTTKAEGYPTRKSKQQYKDLKVYAKVLKQFGKSDLYTIKIEIVNTGSTTISFLEESSSYSWTFVFSAGGIHFVNKTERLYLEKKIPKIPTIKNIEKKISILPHQKHSIKTEVFIHDRKVFLNTNNNLKLIFIFCDANLLYREDVIKIPSNTIIYNW